MFKVAFWKQAFERAVKSLAQAEIGLFGLDQFNVLHADWRLALGIGTGAAVLSVLTSLVSLPITGTDSLVDPKEVPPTA